MTTPVKLQLNEAALAALFPEGSEARVQLQNAVIANFATKSAGLKMLDADVKHAITEAVEPLRQHVKYVMEDQVRRIGNQIAASAGLIEHGPSYALSTQTLETLRKQVSNLINDFFNQQVEAQIKSAIERRVTELTQSELFNEQTTQAIRRAVTSQLVQKLVQQEKP